MNVYDRYFNENEKPLERLVQGYSHTQVFRKIAFVGDSLSSGEFQMLKEDGTWGYYDLYEYSWGQYIARKNGLTAYNFSRGGMTASWYLESFAEENGFWDKEKACQAYVIALGVNDLINKKMPLGAVEDIDVTDYTKNKPTFIGNYARIIARYKEIQPSAKFFFVSFPKRAEENLNEIAVELLKQLNELTKIFDNSYVIDLYNYAPVYDAEFMKRFYLNGHMNPSGYIFTAELIDSYIDYIVRKNYEDFKTAGLIGSGINDY
ncbi:MAG: SGNH/GDSL hydrolase family protein [Clostridia bacterium]|nr:SGNH/GDSL hydrolase family protein [Clostridia bacterium]